MLSLLLVLAASPVNAQPENSQADDRSLQRSFLQTLVDEDTTVRVFLVTNVNLDGVIVGFDDVSFLLERTAGTQLFFIHGVIDIVPLAP